MLYVYPDYYKNFRCTADKCRHNCCIGWEIDIDPETAEFYNTVSGKMGQKLRDGISNDSEPHFILTKDERCPFLNEQNLCDIIIDLGEDRICDICTEHPRFHNELPGRYEKGIGLCCEEAARLILSQSAPVQLEVTGKPEYEDEIIVLRDKVISALQNRSIDFNERITEMLKLCGTKMPEGSVPEWAEFFLTLERMDEEWTQLLIQLKDGYSQADIEGFDTFMSSRQTEYEQFTVYLIYRHFANASDEDGTAERARFAALGYLMLHSIGAVIWTQTGKFGFDKQINIARLFSSEIEYSDENLYVLLEKFEEAPFFINK